MVTLVFSYSRAFRSKQVTYFMRQKLAVMIYGLEAFYGGLHCGEGFAVLVGTEWVSTRIEMGDNDHWYMAGVYTSRYGLTVRM